MGEYSFIHATKEVTKNIPSICINGLNLSEHLGKLLKKLNINFGKDAEIDIINIFSQEDEINLVFGECKVIQTLENTSLDKFIRKVKASLDQAKRDVDLFLTLFPDLTEEDLEKINFITLSILPTTLSQQFDICPNCSKSIVFRDDLNPDYKHFESVAELLY